MAIQTSFSPTRLTSFRAIVAKDVSAATAAKVAAAKPVVKATGPVVAPKPATSTSPLLIGGVVVALAAVAYFVFRKKGRR